MDDNVKDKWATLKYPGSFSSSKNLTYSLLKDNKKVKKAKFERHVKTELKKSLLFQAHRDLQEHFHRRGDITTSFGQKFEMDVADLGNRVPFNLIQEKYRPKGPRKQLLFLVVVDVYTRKIFARGLKTKKGEEIVKCLTDICNNLNSQERFPLQIESDKGLEFNNTAVKSFCAKHGIILNFAAGQNKARMCERAIRSMKRVIMAHVQIGKLTESLSWNQIVETAANSLNGRYNRDIKMSPNEVEKNNEIVLKRAWDKMDVTPFEDFVEADKKINKGEGFAENGEIWHLKDTVLIPIKKVRRGFVKDKEFLIHYELLPRIIDKIYHDQIPALFRLKNAATGHLEKRLYYSKELRKVILPKKIKIDKFVRAEIIQGKGLVFYERNGEQHLIE